MGLFSKFSEPAKSPLLATKPELEVLGRCHGPDKVSSAGRMLDAAYSKPGMESGAPVIHEYNEGVGVKSRCVLGVRCQCVDLSVNACCGCAGLDEITP